MEYLITLLDKLPILRENLRALIFLALLGLFVGVSGFPLWVAYRNEKQILNYILSHNGEPLGHSFTADQMNLIQGTLRSLVTDNPNTHRAVFGLLDQNNRIIISEYYTPVDGPLPLGFQTVYLPSGSYQVMLDLIRDNRCYSLPKPVAPESYLRDEINQANANYYLSCPSKGEWFLAVYTEEDSTIILRDLQEAVSSLEAGLTLTP